MPSVTDGVNLESFQQYEVAMRQRVDEGKVPGYCSVMLRHGKVLHSDAYGLADHESGLKYGPNVIMRLFCMTKPFVAVAVLKLHEQGKLSVHDAVAKYIPSLKNPRVVVSSNAVFKSQKAKRNMTILHCLTHTSGIGYGPGWNCKPESPDEKMYEALQNACERGEVKSIRNFVDRLAALPLRSEPGTKFCYSQSLDDLGRVVEVVSGKTLGRFLRDHIFKPLKMEDTGFSFPKSKARRVAALYASPGTAANLGQDKAALPRSKEALCRVDGKTALKSRWLRGNECPIESGGGFMGWNMAGLVSTLNDCTKFFKMISDEGVTASGTRIISRETLKRYVWKDLLPEMCGRKQRGDHRGFALPLGFGALGEVGLKKSAKDAKKKSHMYDYDVAEVGMGGAACTYYSLDPRRKTVILWCTQSLDNEAFVNNKQSLWCVNKKAVPLIPSYGSTDSPPKKRKVSELAKGFKKASKRQKRVRTH
jgi:CubicO group peptidase (beta-lactamase class C family)